MFKRAPEQMYRALTLHNNVIRHAKYVNCGSIIQQEGDSFTLAFHTAFDAVAFCLQVCALSLCASLLCVPLCVGPSCWLVVVGGARQRTHMQQRPAGRVQGKHVQQSVLWVTLCTVQYK